MKRISRRQFLKMSVYLTSGLYIPIKLDSYIGPLQCPACNAIVSHYHYFREGKRSGNYCPNCGIETSSRQQKLDNCLAEIFNNKRLESGVTNKVIWDCAQLPFPNPNMVKRTKKPVVLLSEINF